MKSRHRFAFIAFAIVASLLFIYILRIYHHSGFHRHTTAADHESIFEINETKQNYYSKAGIVNGSLDFIKMAIRPGDNLSKMLSGFNISDSGFEEMKKKSTGIINFNKLIAGKTYYLFFDKTDTTRAMEYFIYEESRYDYVLVSFHDTVQIIRGKKEVETEVKTASGIIESSLWDVLKKKNIPAEVIFELSEIYAWAIDFYRLQDGDSFVVVYEQNFIHDEPAGIGKILASLFRHGNKDLFAFYYEQDGTSGYFDRDGKSLRKAFLKAPLKYSRISSGFSRKRFHPILKRFKAHQGIDYAAPYGTPVMAVGNGKVIEARYTAGNGKYVKIRHNNTFTTQYLHLSRFTKGIRQGASVSQGDVIGYVGSTGLATGPHLCYRFWKNGAQVDPMKLMMPAAEGIRKEYIAAFDSLKKSMLGILSSTPETPSRMVEKPY